MKLKFKRLSEKAVIPKFAKPGDAGLDLVATEINLKDYNNDKETLDIIEVKFGLAVEIPNGHVGLLFPRSSIYKQKALLTNSVGVIDSGYRGEIGAYMLGNLRDFGYKVGDRVLQLVIVPIPEIEPEEVEELSETERGEGGFGSTGQ